jgi:ribonuclease Z
MLGTGSPIPDPRRQGPALAVVVGDRSYLVDAGPGIVRQATAAAAQHELKALHAPRLQQAFLTHLHHDHCAGLPDLLYTPWTVGREAPLGLVGPPGTAALAGHIEEAYAEDRRIRLEGREPANAGGWRCAAVDAAPGVVFEDDRVRVTAFEVAHGDWEQSYGYRFETPDRRIVISGDTTYCQAVVDEAAGCDVLVHEVSSSVGLATRADNWRAYHSAFHTSAADVGRIASQAGPGLVVLTHVLLHGASEADLRTELRDAWEGDFLLPDDLDLI